MRLWESIDPKIKYKANVSYWMINNLKFNRIIKINLLFISLRHNFNFLVRGDEKKKKKGTAKWNSKAQSVFHLKVQFKITFCLLSKDIEESVKKALSRLHEIQVLFFFQPINKHWIELSFKDWLWLQDPLRLSVDNRDHIEVLGQRISFQDPKKPAVSHYPPASQRGFLI